jgi:ubiquinone/menaquinone biosynthesis C-methylase UbiE
MNKDKLTKVFDDYAVLYDKYRPRYPMELVEQLIEISQIKKGDKVLEIGCGTGQLTMDFIKKGYAITAIEKGKSLSAITANKIKPYGIGQIIHSKFEEWESDTKFKLMISAQAFHWIDKKVGFDKTLDVLEKDGAIALIWNLDQSQNTAFWKRTKALYNKYLPVTSGGKSLEEVADEYWQYMQKIESLGNFKRIEYPWDKTYSKEDYLGLLNTFSPHMSMPIQKRKKFFQEMEAVIESFDNQVLRHYKTVVLFAKKRKFLI